MLPFRERGEPRHERLLSLVLEPREVGERRELPAVEGLLCGARPVLFNAPHYRDWFGDWVEYIEERSREQVNDELETLFRGKHRPVRKAEIEAARKRFDWQKIAMGFWERL